MNDKQTDKRTDKQSDIQTDKQTDKQFCFDVPAFGPIYRRHWSYYHAMGLSPAACDRCAFDRAVGILEYNHRDKPHGRNDTYGNCECDECGEWWTIEYMLDKLWEIQNNG